MSVRNYFISVITVVILLSPLMVFPSDEELFNNPELTSLIKASFGDFNYETSSEDKCLAPLIRFQTAILSGSFDSEPAYLSRALIHQGTLLMCVAQKIAESEEELVALTGYMLASFEKARDVKPDWRGPYYALGNYYHSLSGAFDREEYLKKAEYNFRKALGYSPETSEIKNALQIVRDELDSFYGFKPTDKTSISDKAQLVPFE